MNGSEWKAFEDRRAALYRTDILRFHCNHLLFIGPPFSDAASNYFAQRLQPKVVIDIVNIKARSVQLNDARVWCVGSRKLDDCVTRCFVNIEAPYIKPNRVLKLFNANQT